MKTVYLSGELDSMKYNLKEIIVDLVLQCTQTATCKIKIKVKELQEKNLAKFPGKHWSETKNQDAVKN